MTFHWNNVKVASNSAQDIREWPITSKIAECEVVMNSNGEDSIRIIHFEADIWPELDTGAEDAGIVNRTLWTFVWSNNLWHAATIDYLRSGQSIKGMARDQYGDNYACQVPGGFAAQAGMEICYMISTPARYSNRTINERSDVVMIKYGEDKIIWREGSSFPVPEPTPNDSLQRQVDALRLKVGKIEAWIASFK